MKADEIEKGIKKTFVLNVIMVFLGITVSLFLLSEEDIPWVGMLVALGCTLAGNYTVYSRNIEAHYKLASKLPEEYMSRVEVELRNRRFAVLVLSNWFVKQEEQLRHKF